MIPKIIRTPNGFSVKLVKANTNGLACCHCDKPIDANDYMASCSNCGGLFCESCVISGEFDRHTCDDEDGM